MFLKYLWYKGRNQFSLFLLSFSFLFPQLNLENLIHLNDFDLQKTLPENKIEFYNATDILFVDQNDSSKTYNSYSFISVNQSLPNYASKIKLINYFDYLKTSDDFLLFKMKNKYTAINAEFLFKTKFSFNPLLFTQIDNNQNYSLGLGSKFNYRYWQFIPYFKFYIYDYFLFLKYDDFILSIPFKRKENIINVDLIYNKPLLKSNLKISYQKNYIDNSQFNFSIQKIANNHYEKFSLEELLSIKLSKKQKIQFYLKSILSKQSISLVNDNPIIEIYDLSIQDYFFKINYFYNYNQNLGLLFRKINLDCTGRVRTSVFGNNLLESLGAPIVNNYDYGSIISKGFFFQKQKIFKDNFLFSYNITLLKDYYNITIKNDLISSFTIAPEVDIDQFKYKNKIAAEIGIKFDYNWESFNFLFSINQHIPLKITKIDKDIDSNNFNNQQYGGGKFKLLITKNL